MPCKSLTRHHCLVACVWLLLTLFAGSSYAQKRVVELEIRSDARSVVGVQQRWMEMLQSVGADRVVVKTGAVAQPSVEEVQLSSSTLITVTGSLAGNRLLLPGGSYRITDKAGIKTFIEQLRNDGAKVALSEKKAFGLTSEQLVSLHKTLSKPVDFETKDQPAGEVVRQIERLLGQSIEKDSIAAAALRKGDTVSEELKGVSSGTALAAIGRPLGLVLAPKKGQGGRINLRIVDYQSADENWPIGWPIEQAPVNAEPRLFERLELEIRGFPLQDALDAIETRIGVPFFYDLNAFARQDVDTAAAKVTLVQKKVSFMVAIDKLLRQSKPKLKYELRQDENGKSFLWITTW